MKLSEQKRIYDKNTDLICKYRAGDSESGEELIKINQPLVYSIAGRFIGRGVDLEELVAIGNLGLAKAIASFDIGRECAFSTYAVPLIFGEIRRFLRDDGIIKISREQKRLYAILNAEKEKRLNTGGDIGIASLAEAVGVCPADAAAAMFAGAPVRSLDESAYDDDERETLGSTVCEEGAVERGFDRLAVKMAVEGLPLLERNVIVLRYYKDLSQAQTAKILGLTQVKISRIEKKVLALLRTALE